jgi:hypothetical protein
MNHVRIHRSTCPCRETLCLARSGHTAPLTAEGFCPECLTDARRAMPLAGTAVSRRVAALVMERAVGR